jgi:uncharacterized phage-like protein YoqJ
MIRLQWTARISRGKNQGAIQWAKQVAEYLKSKYPKILAIAAYEEHFGNVNTIHIFSDYESLAALEAVESQYPSDAAFQDLFNKSNEAGLFIEGSIHGTLVKSL